ncbi:MAG: competence protein ComK [Erysipelotrichaceae bacterium]|nr:competence protein ComK [Erysipelotrichaceae bacterium]
MIFLLKFEQDSFSTYIKTQKGEYVVKGMKSEELIQKFCILCGGTMEGKRKAICQRLDIVQKAPILVSERFLMLMFPIKDYDGVEYWLNYRGIKKIKQQQYKQCTIVFNDQTAIMLHIDYRSIMRQMKRCKLYFDILMMGEEDLEAYILREVVK